MLNLRAKFLVENLDLPRATEIETARWEQFQLAHLNDNSLFRIEVKSRQIAWSWLSAAEAVASAMLEKRDAVFVSINKNEAQEKIRYAQRIYDSLYMKGLPKIVRRNVYLIEFDTGVRLQSLPARPPRGMPKTNVYLDEFAHVQMDEAIYQSAPAIILKGGRVRIGSSPMGASGRFWEIAEEKVDPYPEYTRKRTPWWSTYAFTRSEALWKRAITEADTLTTEERVEMFGDERLQIIFRSMPIEDFQQEFEAMFVDEATSWISWKEIQRSYDYDLIYESARCTGDDTGEAIGAIRRLAELVATGQVESVYTCGMDIGRTKDATEILLLGYSTVKSYPIRLMITLQGTSFDQQFNVLAEVMMQLPILRVLIDQNGIGRNIAENAFQAWQEKIVRATFTQQRKTLWATDAKMMIQQGQTPLPVDRDLAYQIHSIKRIKSGSNNLIFDTERNEKHHADKFWAWALALAGIRVEQRVRYNDQEESGSSSHSLLHR